MKNRTILHSDANCFYASVEMLLNPELRGKAVAVCGCVEERHGIVLAKSEAAKKAGVKTGMANWEAVQACPNLITVPPQYDQYVKFSRLLRNIYLQYSDRVEPFGMDECWIEATGCMRHYASGEALANEIRERVKEELGLTVSIGVSFNKIFAKLGSDMKKPDAVTVLDETNWQERVWPLPVSELLYVGRATTKKLMSRAVYTIGDLAHYPPQFLKDTFGVNGLMLWCFANGEDTSRIMPDGYSVPIKSVGHGITCTCDLSESRDVWKVILELSQDIGHRLRVYELQANGIRLCVRSNDLSGQQYQAQLPRATQSPMEIARAVHKLLEERYSWSMPIRAVTVTAINLAPYNGCVQMDLFGEAVKSIRQHDLDDCIDRIRSRFGSRSIYSASLMEHLPMPGDGRDEVRMPGMMYQ